MSALYKTKFDGYEERVRQSLRDQPFMSKLLDVNILRIEPGVVELAIPVTAQMLQPHGNVHGIVASAVADSAAGYAAQTLLPEGADMVTVEYKINYLAPGIGERIIAVARCYDQVELSLYVRQMFSPNLLENENCSPTS